MRVAGLAVGLAGAIGCHREPATTPPRPTDETVEGEAGEAETRHAPTGEIASTFAVPCFEPGLMRGDKPATCELSAVTVLDGAALALNDKPVPGDARSAALRFDPDAPATAPTHVDGPTFAEFRKYEDAARLPGGEVLITTGFDRIRDDGKWDPYNALFVWRPGAPLRVISESSRKGVRSSRTLRAALQASLADEEVPDGPAYFKVEGLAVTAEGEVLLGIREAGRTYEDFTFRVTLLAAPDLDALAAGEISRVWDGDPAPADLTGPLGLSSLGQDHARGGTWLTTSYELGETDEDLGGYLWWLSDTARRSGDSAQLVRDGGGEPLHFAHKPEGVTVLDDGRLLIVHDDDRVTGRPADQITDARRQFSRGVYESFAQLVVVAGLPWIPGSATDVATGPAQSR